MRIEAMPSAPYIIDMIPVEGQNGTYTMTGMFADVFHNLKVNVNGVQRMTEIINHAISGHFKLHIHFEKAAG